MSVQISDYVTKIMGDEIIHNPSFHDALIHALTSTVVLAKEKMALRHRDWLSHICVSKLGHH